MALVWAGSSLVTAPMARAEEAQATITVVGAAPLAGSTVEIDKIPHAAQTLDAHDLSRGGGVSFTAALGDRLGGVMLQDTLDDPFQPDLIYRGFTASPVLGSPQGLAVYQNGVRINEAFGDALNWDLVPDLAIQRMTLTAGDPIYGLNALGGALALEMKTGFSTPGGSLELSGGGYGRREINGQFGVHGAHLGFYVAARGFDQEGWRAFSPDAVRQAYAALSLRQSHLAADLAVTLADNRLSGESPAPVQELAVDRSLVFTSPQSNRNRLAFTTLNLTWKPSDRFSLSSASYVRDYRQGVINGDTTNYQGCDAGDLLCQPDGTTPLTDRSGRLIADLSQGGTVAIGQIDLAQTHSLGFGETLQANIATSVWGRANRLTLGAGLDQAQTDFATQVELGVIDAQLRVIPSGVFVATSETAGFDATPVRLSARAHALSLYGADSLDLSRDLTLTVSARYNLQRLTLRDHEGTQLNGGGRYGRLNPSIGLTGRLTPTLTAYAQYAETNRAPTASEIECSDPARPCLLPSSLAGDPPTLRQVVAHSVEAGLRGRWSSLNLSWRAGLYRTDLDDDIYGVATSLSGGYFRNIGATRRQGAELGLDYEGARISVHFSYAYLEATFRSTLSVPSPANPYADENGAVTVRPGDRLPGLPQHQAKIELDWRVRSDLTLGGGLLAESSRYYGGDPSNRLSPLRGYAVLNLHADWRPRSGVTLFADLRNALDARYASLGLLGDPGGVGAPGVPSGGDQSAVNPRFQSPGTPVTLSGGLRLEF